MTKDPEHPEPIQYYIQVNKNGNISWTFHRILFRFGSTFSLLGTNNCMNKNSCVIFKCDKFKSIKKFSKKIFSNNEKILEQFQIPMNKQF